MAVRNKTSQGVLLALALASGCRRGGGVQGSPDGIRVVEVELPAGGDKDALARCHDDGSHCDPVAQGEGVESGSMVKSGRGARAWLAVDPATSLDLGEQSAVVFAKDGEVRVQSGSAVIRRLGAGEGPGDEKKPGATGEPFRIALGGRSAEI